MDAQAIAQPVGQPIASGLNVALSPHAPALARRHTRAVLTAWGVTEEVTDDVVLIVSELVTNAVSHASVPRGRREAFPVLLRLRRSDGHLAVEVWDPDARPPQEAREHSCSAEQGRGLTIVSATAERWSYCPVPGRGKVVWCHVALAEKPREGV
ncbi:ATP-binding protein [Allostreptomyces psammosilenae]|uniref:Anti-sigma regulatory factor (Ser/Thr protein kinase) n=1 Tax=Allostreptomyces psammosilenae TaxID=1892865 RepID=A0A853A2S4_9ACTN|nr:ATP-binding protein [Allostreptomyces psammosilenae]NYI05041.1 anti-sigma regulatory factor (Ser/Thr protein kinase) [Allostreptomyces psammosilenae]